MAPKRRRGGAQAVDDGLDPQASKLNINSYEDVADSEDEFHINRDKILLEEGPEAKRRRRMHEEDIEASDEEVLGYSSEDEHDNHGPTGNESDDDQSEDNSGDEDDGNWGSSKKDYYNADKLETEQDMLEEEAEARRIQQKRLQALREEDFGFDEHQWQEDDKEEAQDGVRTEILPQVQITDDMTDQDKLQYLVSRYPEFEPMTKELLAAQQSYDDLVAIVQDQKLVVLKPPSAAALKLQAVSAFLGASAMYLVLLTSPAAGHTEKSVALAPHELHTHEIMHTYLQSRKLWMQVSQLEDEPHIESSDEAELLVDMSAENKAPAADRVSKKQPKKKAKKKDDAVLEASLARRQARAAATEASLARLDAQIAKASARKAAPTSTVLNRADSDIGDEVPLSANEAAEKARKKKSLRFYTSQIAQKANKRANAGRAAGGDDDLPYRERLKDRQARLMKEAEKRGRREAPGAPLNDGDDGDSEVEMTNKERETQGEALDEGESAMEAKVLAKKAGKAAREAAYQQAKAEGGRVVQLPRDEIGKDGRREIGYKIEKNKGLTPKRKKDVKNPRVKKRKRFEDKTKKLKSIKPVFKGGEGRGGYGGEMTGIKKNLVKSVKL